MASVLHCGNYPENRFTLISQPTKVYSLIATNEITPSARNYKNINSETQAESSQKKFSEFSDSTKESVVSDEEQNRSAPDLQAQFLDPLDQEESSQTPSHLLNTPEVDPVHEFPESLPFSLQNVVVSTEHASADEVPESDLLLPTPVPIDAAVAKMAPTKTVTEPVPLPETPIVSAAAQSVLSATPETPTEFAESLEFQVPEMAITEVSADTSSSFTSTGGESSGETFAANAPTASATPIPQVPADSTPIAPTHIGAVDVAKNVTRTVADSLVQQVQYADDGVQKSLVVQLHPAELGQVTLQVDWENDVLKAKIVTNEMAASDILNQNKSQLVAALSENGLTFDSLDVAHQDAQQDYRDPEESGDSLPASLPQSESNASESTPAVASESGSNMIDIVV